MNLFRVLLLLFVLPIYAQQGGMWIPSLLEGMNENEMKNLGMKMSAKDIYSVNESSIKDAVPHFNGGCTSEVISPKGLLLTNHHCGYYAIQTHSSLAHDYLTNGFWAMSLEEELPNENLVVTFIKSIHDVTQLVLEGVSNLESEESKQALIKQNMAKVINTFAKEPWQENKIKTFFEGNQYILFVTETFKDVRLVGTPPNAIGKFGSDTDNWVWPRHTADFSIFRIYADKNNRPAAYSKENVPYTPKHFLPISLDGVQEDDFTMVMGFPGRTQEYLPSFAVDQILQVTNPARIEIRDASLKIQNEFMRKDPAIKIKYASKNASIANYWKKWIGESQGLKKSDAIALKQNFEKDFLEKVAAANKQKEYGNLLTDFEKYYKEIAPYTLSKDYFEEVVLRNTELLSIAFKLYELEQIYITNGEQAFKDKKEGFIKGQQNFYKDFHAVVDQKIFEQLIQLYSEKAPKQLLPNTLQNIDVKKLTDAIYKSSKLVDFEKLKELLSGDSKKVIHKINSDKGYAFLKSLAVNFKSNVNPKYSELKLKIDALQRTYMKAQLEFYKNTRIFPDANSTFRVTYGKVKGYAPKDAVYYTPVSYLDGVIEKYIPGDYEFDVPKKLIDLYNNKDYGQYAENGKMPLCFLGTNHTTGGNSGSPAIDAQGNLIGLNFDRVWEGTMSDIHYDPAICRNIMVDLRFILFIIDKYAGATHLINEMKLVHPKRN